MGYPSQTQVGVRLPDKGVRDNAAFDLALSNDFGSNNQTLLITWSTEPVGYIESTLSFFPLVAGQAYPRPQTPHPTPHTPHPEPQTPNPKLQTPNPKP